MAVVTTPPVNDEVTRLSGIAVGGSVIIPKPGRVTIGVAVIKPVKAPPWLPVNAGPEIEAGDERTAEAVVAAAGVSTSIVPKSPPLLGRSVTVCMMLPG